MSRVCVEGRFCGPPDSGNGGYCCGLLARFVGEPAQVTLRAPPPLDRPLDVVEGGTTRLLDGDTLVAEAQRAKLDLEVPAPVSFEEAQASSERYIARHEHAFPTCFVCGPRRDPGDGLRIFAGRRSPGEPVAAPWIPDPSVCDADGLVRPEILWAALDCPGYFGVTDVVLAAVLGRMTAAVRPVVRAGDRLVAMGWSLGRDGRKLAAGSALFTEGGELVGRSRQTWIVLAPR